LATAVAVPEQQTVAPGVNPWVVALTVTIATFMELLDTSIANVSLPHIAGGLSRSFDEVTWILTTYLVANAVVLPMSAWLSRVFGRKNYYMSCVALFTIASFFCGIAPSLPILLLARIFQGVGGGGLAPVEQAILVDTFPPSKRAAAFALYTIAIVTAPAIGPVLGGWITDHYTWRWVFLVNIPFGLLSLFLTNRFVQDPPGFAEERKQARLPSGKLRIDWLGMLLIGVGSAALEVLLDRGQIDDWFGSPFITAMFATALTCLVAAVFWELFHPDPLIDFRVLAIRNFGLANFFFFLFGFGLFASTTIDPQLLQSLYGYTATDAGLVLGPGAIVITMLAPLCAQLVQRRVAPPRVLLFLSLIIVGVAFIHHSRFNLDTDYHHFLMARVYQGLGYAFFFVPLSVITYSQLAPEQNNKASSLTNFFRNWGGSFGVAFVTTVSARRQNFHQAIVGVNVHASSSVFQETVARMTAYLRIHGFSQADAATAAYANVYARLQAQAALLSFMDCFYVLGLVTLCAAPLALLTKSFVSDVDSTAAH